MRLTFVSLTARAKTTILKKIRQPRLTTMVPGSCAPRTASATRHTHSRARHERASRSWALPVDMEGLMIDLAKAALNSATERLSSPWAWEGMGTVRGGGVPDVVGPATSHSFGLVTEGSC